MPDNHSPLPAPQYRAIRIPLEALDLRLQLLLRRLRRRQWDPQRLEREVRIARTTVARLSKQLDDEHAGSREPPAP